VPSYAHSQIGARDGRFWPKAEGLLSGGRMQFQTFTSEAPVPQKKVSELPTVSTRSNRLQEAILLLAQHR
jgi:hypothetical protein